MEFKVKSSSHEGILLACFDISRPMSVRKVWTSGTKGVGDGTGEGAFLWSDRMYWLEIDTGLNRRAVKPSGELRIAMRLMVKVFAGRMPHAPTLLVTLVFLFPRENRIRSGVDERNRGAMPFENDGFPAVAEELAGGFTVG